MGTTAVTAATARELRALAATPSSAPPEFAPAHRVGDLVYTSGQLPIDDEGLAATGLLGRDVTVERGGQLARLCTANALAAIAEVVDLSHIERVVKLTGFVASAPGFHEQPEVMNGASSLLREVLGSAGAHTRSAIGVAALPRNAPVEVELVVSTRS
ncbi:MAG: RidA family protein [Actinomycetales bacterium]|nr:RidA family protein [Actinomycetales bacterium]